MSDENHEGPRLVPREELTFPVQVVFSHPEQLEEFEKWIDPKGVQLSPPMMFSEEDLPTYTMRPTPERWAELMAQAQEDEGAAEQGA